MSLSSTTGRRSLALAAAILLLAVAFLVFSVSARADTLTLAGGYTELTTDPGTTKALVATRILPLPVFPSWVVPANAEGKLALRYRFYITGGKIESPPSLAGEIYHSGGLKFANLTNGKSLTVRDFTIDTVSSQLTAYVPALDVRAAILKLDLSGVKVTPGSIYTKVGPVPAKLTAIAATVLNTNLDTRLFAEDLPIGTANVYARFAK
jgi:hypothetical protein